MLMSVIFFSVNDLSNFDWIGGGFLRYDWLACVVIAVCMIHKNRYKTAGALLSYATMVRLFPILFGLGIGIKATFTFIEKRLIPQKYRQFFLSFILTSVILFAYGSSYGKGIDNWVKFSQKIARHSQTLIPNNTGFKMIFLHDKGWSGFKKFLEVYGRTKENPFILLKELKKSEFDQRKGEFLLFATAALLLFFLIIKNKDDLEAFVWGFFLIFMLLYLSCYYYSFLLMFIIIFYKREINLTNTLYLVLLFLTQIAAYLIGGSYFGFRLHIFYRVSLILFIYLFYLITSELYRKFRYQGFNQSV
jgi:hypothetical protein